MQPHIESPLQATTKMSRFILLAPTTLWSLTIRTSKWRIFHVARR
jgi:hypothetical protein